MKKRKQKLSTDKLAKVFFDLQHDDSGYPPAKTEFLWCIPTTQGTFVVDNIPFFVRDISLGDEISVSKTGSKLSFSRLVRESRNSTVRVLMKLTEKTAEVRKKLDSLGCDTELMDDLGLLAISMSPDSKVAESLSFLDQQAAKGIIGIEESAVRYK